MHAPNPYFIQRQKFIELLRSEKFEHKAGDSLWIKPCGKPAACAIMAWCLTYDKFYTTSHGLSNENYNRFGKALGLSQDQVQLLFDENDRRDFFVPNKPGKTGSYESVIALLEQMFYPK